ncbi:hypothetical protein AYO20_06836 [Fonsecaea nubica]|uniref:Uncharacterized protein n=1 Tax=Fonsecaea nubica TaxID=856822 RepID=A0A178CY78_9EURO|nr:hypothetical protein AYO20_06836 [Fonsecaea nubica]OAL33825.1 hypothetical protein AYO20_06836 [Fonsecaea nubica]
MPDTGISPPPIYLKHIEDIRNLSVCSRKMTKKNCPDCRARVTVEPSPNYLLRDLVHVLIARAELLPEDETLQEHQLAKEAEAAQLAADRTGPGLFQGLFRNQERRYITLARGLLDQEDNVVRCPQCHWELEEGECMRCGFHETYDSDSDTMSHFNSPRLTSSEYDSLDEIDHAFDGSMNEAGLDYYSGERSPRSYTTDEYESYGEEDDMDNFIDNEADEADDNTDSESTMTMYNRQWAENESSYANPSEYASQTSADSDHRQHFGRHGTYAQRSRNDVEEISDAETNYDEVTEDSDHEPEVPQPSWRRTRAARVILSDDDDDEEEEGEGGEEQDDAADEAYDDPFENRDLDHRNHESDDQHGEDEGDERYPSEHSETEVDQDCSDSEGSDVRPPQPSARRRQHLQILQGNSTAIVREAVYLKTALQADGMVTIDPLQDQALVEYWLEARLAISRDESEIDFQRPESLV